jgi:hypothetical protein
MTKKQLNDSKPKRSIFHTNEPRNPMTRVHLLLVFISLMSSMAIAIVLAETRSPDKSCAQKSPQSSRLIDSAFTANLNNR